MQNTVLSMAMPGDPSPNAVGSREQHRKSRALVVITSTNVQFIADPFDGRPDNFHSQSFAGGWIKSFRQNRTVIGDQQRVSGIAFQLDRDPAFAAALVISSLTAKLSGMLVTVGSSISTPSTTMTRSGLSPESNIAEKSRQRSSRYCLNATLRTPSK